MDTAEKSHLYTVINAKEVYQLNAKRVLINSVRWSIFIL